MKPRLAFTLIELLVVLAIMGILSSMLFPSLARAREGGRRTSCASNLKQLVLSFSLYRDDYDSTYPMAYYYDANGVDETGNHYQFTHWSWLLKPYIKNDHIYLCPSSTREGSSPYNCDTHQHPECKTDQYYGIPPHKYEEGGSAGITDRQVLRLSYTTNEAILARKRTASTPVNTVIDAAIDSPSTVIVLAEASGNYNDNGLPDGWPTHSYRPLSVITKGSIDEEFEAEHSSGQNLRAIPPLVGRQVVNRERPDLPTLPCHIVHLNPNAHFNGSNYAFLDGHVKWLTLESTLDPKHFLWGTRMYSKGNAPIFAEDGVTPIE